MSSLGRAISDLLDLSLSLGRLESTGDGDKLSHNLPGLVLVNCQPERVEEDCFTLEVSGVRRRVESALMDGP